MMSKRYNCLPRRKRVRTRKRLLFGKHKIVSDSVDVGTVDHSDPQSSILHTERPVLRVFVRVPTGDIISRTASSI
jgi:hypothetical protein